ncbi:hypothetical protein [Paenibacillus arenosi]|uniref:Uncharacterized protein n=1 Tax=Paenibacillus arenosi TaxID=2774142 RepID=A0ABR9B1X1_9BACL|nr:hypothetical protein [Paenibacillus arenosi]MBD8499176.1 hypothetical protein [Paenibacillus arenosi]
MSMTITAVISQSTAILLERARQAGFTTEELLDIVTANDVPRLERAATEHFTYEDWISYAKKHGEPLEQAIREGYRLTFNTVNGLKWWLRYKYDIVAEEDYEVGDGRFNGLKLSAVQITELKQVIARNWVVIDEVEHEQIASTRSRVIDVAVRAKLTES